MCGIAGIFAYNSASGEADRDELRAMRDHMAARGPDGSGEWFSPDGRMGLGHRRLSIIDLSERGAQPMFSADGRYVISFNGEIYNYRELRRKLEAAGRSFRTESDTEVVLHLYAEKGRAMLHDLRGMFAFALWDSERKQLLLARDPFGIKPIYYTAGGGTFRFASQVKALLQTPVDRSPSAAGHAGFFLWGSVPEPWTLYNNIRALAAGHTLIVEEGRVGEPVAYCRIRDVLAESAGAPAQGTRSDALEAVSAAVKDSVAAHLVADVPVGVFLSAGIDSCLIASAAAAGGTRPHTLTLGFSEFAGSANDEAPLAEEVARSLDARHNTLLTSRDDFEAESDKLFAAMDQPSIDGVNTWFVARAARQMGLKVALSGLGGDELFASYPSFKQVPALVRFGRPLTGAPSVGKALRKLSSPFVSAVTSPKYAGLAEYSQSLGSAYLLCRSLFAPWELPSVMPAELAREGLAELESVENLDRTTRGIGVDRLAVSALELEWYTRNQLLRDADWAGMAQSLEIRVPFLDMEMLRQVAPWFAAYPDIRKAEVAQASAPLLPPAVFARPKTGFSVPVRDWIRSPGEGKRQRGLRGWAQSVHLRFGATAG